jgi:hypothetical protein
MLLPFTSKTVILLTKMQWGLYNIFGDSVTWVCPRGLITFLTAHLPAVVGLFHEGTEP